MTPVGRRWRARLVSNGAPGGWHELITAGGERAASTNRSPSLLLSSHHPPCCISSPPPPRDRLWSLTAHLPPSLSTPHHTACTEKSFPAEVEREIRLACRCRWNIGQNLTAGANQVDMFEGKIVKKRKSCGWKQVPVIVIQYCVCVFMRGLECVSLKSSVKHKSLTPTNEISS